MTQAQVLHLIVYPPHDPQKAWRNFHGMGHIARNGSGSQEWIEIKASGPQLLSPKQGTQRPACVLLALYHPEVGTELGFGIPERI